MPERQMPKLLVVIASFGTSQDRFLEAVIQEYKRMPYHVDVVVVSNVSKPVPAGVELVVGLPTSDPWSLPFAHKKVMADRLERYDLFIYSENDTPILEKNIEGFLHVSEFLPEHEIPGFLRYENGPRGTKNFISAHGHYHWDPSSVVTRGPYTLAFLTNEHSACYLITQEQLRKAIDSGTFLLAPYRGKYDLACTAATDPYTRAGQRKLICISHLDDFLVHHLPDKYTPPDFSEHEQEFSKQIDALLAIGTNGRSTSSLIPSETKLPDAKYSKDYYEPVRGEVVSELPPSVRSVLSVGSGSGKTEECLAAKGVQVTAIPLDSIIGKCLEGTAVEVVNVDLSVANAKLQGREFDCLFLSNILHLVPDPAQTLARLCELIRPGGYALIVTPHVATLKNRLNRMLGKQSYKDVGSYDRGGVHNVSRASVETWIRAAGCTLERLKWLTTPRVQKISRFAPALLNSLLGSEIIAVARKAG